MSRTVRVSPPFADFPMIREIGRSQAAAAHPGLREHRNRGIELCLIHSGRHEWQVEGRAYRLGPGDGFVTLPWQRHGGELGIRHRGLLDFVVVAPARCGPRGGWSWGAWCQLDREARRFVERTLLANLSAQVPQAGELAPVYDRLWAELRGARPGRRGMVHGLLGDLLLMMARLVHERRDRTTRDERLERTLAEVRAHLDEPWTLAAMAARAGLGRTRFAELVKQRCGCSPLRYLEQQRIDAARAALAYGHQSVTHIAFDLGFSSSQYFATVFKRHVGVSPREYRRRR